MAYPNNTAPFGGIVGSIGSGKHALSPYGHAGPAVYVQFSAGAGAGDTLYPSEFGLQWLMHVRAGITSNGLYEVKAVNPTAVPAATIPLVWTDLTTGLEVTAGTDLSGSTVNLHAIGY